MNQTKTVLLLGALTGLLVLLGGVIGGRGGMMIALVLAVAMNFFSYWYSDKIVLAMYQAQPVDEYQAPGLYNMVRELAATAGLPVPRVYIIEDETPNAFATGRDPEHAVVAVTSGIMRILNPRELRGVLAHELAHVKDRDILIGSVAATLAGAVMVLANLARFGAIFGGGRDDEEGGGGGMLGMILMSILAPVGAFLIQMAVSRGREYLADQEGAAMARDPEALAAALGKLEQANQAQPMLQAQPQTAHMFIVNPLSGSSFASLFSTHPPIAERMARLRAMAGQGYAQPYVAPMAPGGYAPPPPPPPRGGQGGIDWS
ncbi:MAG: zinc metalloprotease HtpX [Desulfarculus sp.]|nr:zinc metalloprotease HtpX [Desulfarculus sp.]